MLTFEIHRIAAKFCLARSFERPGALEQETPSGRPSSR
jgi:hypothetical protein